ncbi:MAG: MATE family efflux transporter [Lachnospiraceae bacterium]|nr:MATE family efflux transporter [Lachnospiraceae bacterium]
MSSRRLPVPEKGFFKHLLILAVPMVLQNLVTFLVGFADNIMVGTLRETAISGVYIGNQVQTILQMIVIGVDSAMLILAAQYWGAKNTDSIKKLLVIALSISAGLAVILSVVVFIAPYGVMHLFTQDEAVIGEAMRYVTYVRWTYILFVSSQILLTGMRSVEKVRIGMYTSFISLGVNVVLNYIFIFGKLGAPAMGVAGAGLATLISRIVEFGIAFGYVLFIDGRLHFRLPDFIRSDRKLWADFFRYGAPVIAGWIVWGINNAFRGAVVGSMGSSVTAAVSIYSNCSQMANVILSGVSGALGIITGQLAGAGEVERVKNHARLAQLLLLGIGVSGCLLINLIKMPFIRLYSVSEETAVIARQILTSFSFLFIGTCVQGHAMGCTVKPGGDTRFVFINDTIFVFLFVIPAAALCRYVWNLAPWIVFTVLKSDEVLKWPVAFIKINSFNWIHNLTRSEESAGPEQITGRA